MKHNVVIGSNRSDTLLAENSLFYTSGLGRATLMQVKIENFLCLATYPQNHLVMDAGSIPSPSLA
ncbi:MAG: hypothetical protein WBG44_02915 [Comamonas sp.]